MPLDAESEQLRDYKDSLVQSLAPPMIETWIEKVVDTANGLCGGSASIMYERADNGYLGKIVAPTTEGMKCLARAIDIHVPAAPKLVREILMSYKANLLLS